MSKLFALLVAAGVGLSVLANAQTSLPCPDINDASHATKDVNEFLPRFLCREKPAQARRNDGADEATMAALDAHLTSYLVSEITSLQ